MALFIVGSYAAKPHIPIYGAEWDGSSNPAWTRTDDAVGFADPNPYYAGMSGSPSSPFDNIMPWSGMRIVEDASAGTLVEIPKFYYKWTRNGTAMKLQISMSPFDGSFVSPAHADRGDNIGERDYVYVGRYHCAADANIVYKSVTSVLPLNSLTRAAFRTDIHNLGTAVWQNDFAMWWTIRMLYLVEFAHWNSQSKIGYGCGDNVAIGNMGYTDSMPYHTGTTQLAKDTYGLGTQYRYIEGLWDNVYDWVDGISFSTKTSTYRAIRCTLNPSLFNDSGSGSNVGTRDDASLYGGRTTTRFTNPTVSGYEWALYPDSTNSVSDDYVCDSSQCGSVGQPGANLKSGGDATNQATGYGLFHLSTTGSTSSSSTIIGSRLMVLPPSRLTA